MLVQIICTDFVYLFINYIWLMSIKVHYMIITVNVRAFFFIVNIKVWSAFCSDRLHHLRLLPNAHSAVVELHAVGGECKYE